MDDEAQMEKNLKKEKEWSLNAHHHIPRVKAIDVPTEVSCNDFRTEPSVGAAAAPSNQKHEPMVPCSPELQSIGALRTIVAWRLCASITKSRLIDLFKSAGEIVEVRLFIHPSKKYKSRCLIEFATEEAAHEALKFNRRTLSGCHIDVRPQALIICVRGLDASSGIGKMRSSLKEHFSTCGQFSFIFTVLDDHTGAPNGVVFFEFCNRQSFPKALAMNGQKIGDSPLTIEDATLLQLEMEGFGPQFFLRKRAFGPYGGTCYTERYPCGRGFHGAGIGKVGSPYNPPSGKKIKFDDDDDDD